MKTVAVIGAGYWGKNLVRNYFELGALHSVCDARREVLSALQKTYPNVTYSAKYEDVLADKSVKAVVIALPAESHYECTEKALRAGPARFLIHNSFCRRRSTAELSAVYRPMKIGICRNSGRQPPIGLILCFRHSSI